MSIVLALCIVAVAGWLLLNLVTGHLRNRSTSTTSVAGFSRALGALDPAHDPARHRARSPAVRRPWIRPPAAPPARTPRRRASTGHAPAQRSPAPVRRSADKGVRGE